LCRHLKVSHHSMEPEGSLLCSQELTTSPYPAPDQCRPSHCTAPYYLYKIHLNIIPPPTSRLSRGLFPSVFTTNNLLTFIFSPIRATCHTHLILLDVISLIILGYEYKPYNSALRSVLQPSVNSSLFSLNVLNTLLLNTLIQCSSLHIRDQTESSYRKESKFKS
jgi:hypothetical protein